MKFIKITCLTFLFSASVFAQKIDDPQVDRGAGAITDGGATYTTTSFGADAASVDLTGVGAGDQIFEYGWFFGISGAAEAPFGDPSSSAYVGNTATINWVGLGGVLDVTETVVITETAAGQGSLLNTLLVTNTSASDQTINFFHYADIDVAGSFGGDVGALTNSPDFITITDGETLEYRGGGNDAFQVIAFPGVEPILVDAAADNLDNTGLPFGPGDWTGAFQWSNLLIPAGGTATFGISLGANTPAPVPTALAISGGGTSVITPSVPDMSTVDFTVPDGSADIVFSNSGDSDGTLDSCSLASGVNFSITSPVAFPATVIASDSVTVSVTGAVAGTDTLNCIYTDSAGTTNVSYTITGSLLAVIPFLNMWSLLLLTLLLMVIGIIGFKKIKPS